MEISRHVEPRLNKYLFSKASKLNIPLSGTFELSPVCNFSCKMCYVRKTEMEVQKSLRNRFEIDDWLRIAEKAKKQGLLYLLLTGGEPLLWKDFWKLYETLIQMGFLISINTNGSLITEEIIQRFRKYPPVRINITLYGASDETYEKLCGVKGIFQKIDQAIEGLKREHIPIKLNGSLTPYNVSDLEKCVRYAQAHNLIYEPVSYMFPPLRRDESMVGKNARFTPSEAAFFTNVSYKLLYGAEAYHNRLTQIVNGVIPPPGIDEGCVDPIDGRVRCRAGSASFWITWDGYMTPCGMMTKPAVDLKGKTFTDAWNDLVKKTSEITLSGICTGCPNQKLCHSCAAMALAETGSFDKVPIYLCHMVNAMKEQAEKELFSSDENSSK